MADFQVTRSLLFCAVVGVLSHLALGVADRVGLRSIKVQKQRPLHAPSEVRSRSTPTQFHLLLHESPGSLAGYSDMARV